MRVMAIPRLDPAGTGIHLIWTWPDVLPLSEGGYDIQRLTGHEQRSVERCETIDARIIGILRARAEYPAPLGPLRLKSNVRFRPVTDSSLVVGGGPELLLRGQLQSTVRRALT